VGGGEQTLHGLFAQAPGGRVGHAQEGVVVPRIDRNPHVGQEIASFPAVEEALSAHHMVADSRPTQRRFKRAGLGVGAVEDREMREGYFFGEPRAFDGGDGRFGLLLLVGKRPQADRRPVAAA